MDENEFLNDIIAEEVQDAVDEMTIDDLIAQCIEDARYERECYTLKSEGKECDYKYSYEEYIQGMVEKGYFLTFMGMNTSFLMNFTMTQLLAEAHAIRRIISSNKRELLEAMENGFELDEKTKIGVVDEIMILEKNYEEFMKVIQHGVETLDQRILAGDGDKAVGEDGKIYSDVEYGIRKVNDNGE